MSWAFKMGDQVPENAVEFALCCPAMRRAVGVDSHDESPGAPWLTPTGPVTILGSSAKPIARDPVRFCPWCGREILPKDRRITLLWDLRLRLAEKEEAARGAQCEDALNINLGQQTRLRMEISALEEKGRRPST